MARGCHWTSPQNDILTILKTEKASANEEKNTSFTCTILPRPRPSPPPPTFTAHFPLVPFPRARARPPAHVLSQTFLRREWNVHYKSPRAKGRESHAHPGGNTGDLLIPDGTREKKMPMLVLLRAITQFGIRGPPVPALQLVPSPTPKEKEPKRTERME